MRDEILFLGTASGVPSAERLHAALLLRLGGAALLLDCGEPCAHALKRRRVDFAGIDAVFVTHAHLDHIGGLPMLLHAMRFERRRRALAVHLPRRVIPALRAWLRGCLVDERRLGYAVAWRAISTRTPARVGGVRVAAYRTSHLDAARRRWSGRRPQPCFDAYALLARAGGKAVAYTGDLGGPGDLEPLLRRPLDALVAEATHVDAAAIARAVAGREVARVLLTHVGPDSLATGAAKPPRPLRLVRDGDRIPL